MPRKHCSAMPLFICLLLRTVQCKQGRLSQEIPTDEDDAFHMLAKEQINVCCRNTDCASSPGESEEIRATDTTTSYTTSNDIYADYISHSCCGTCSRGAECILYGTCCLDVYRNFTHALESTQNVRFVNPPIR